MIAALYVAPGGVYWNLSDVEPWGLPERDARRYGGPWAVVAHPPCARWGRFWSGGPSCRERKRKGDDDGCFAAALEAVRQWGGVLEHPEASAAFVAHGLRRPDRGVGWQPAGDWQGWVCCVEQGHYGHRARKATWLYAMAPTLPALEWGPSAATVRLDAGYHSAEERHQRPELRAIERMGRRETLATPHAFRDILLDIARSCPGAESVA